MNQDLRSAEKSTCRQLGTAKPTLERLEKWNMEAWGYIYIYMYIHISKFRDRKRYTYIQL